jgi:hypothetical protein
MVFSWVVPFRRKKKKIPDLSLPPCIYRIYRYCTQALYELFILFTMNIEIGLVIRLSFLFDRPSSYNTGLRKGLESIVVLTSTIFIFEGGERGIVDFDLL